MMTFSNAAEIITSTDIKKKKHTKKNHKKKKTLKRTIPLRQKVVSQRIRELMQNCFRYFLLCWPSQLYVLKLN